MEALGPLWAGMSLSCHALYVIHPAFSGRVEGNTFGEQPCKQGSRSLFCDCGTHLLAEIFRHKVEERCRQLDDLLMSKAFRLQLAVEALCHALVPVLVQVLAIWLRHHFEYRSLGGLNRHVTLHDQESCQTFRNE